MASSSFSSKETAQFEFCRIRLGDQNRFWHAHPDGDCRGELNLGSNVESDCRIRIQGCLINFYIQLNIQFWHIVGPEKRQSIPPPRPKLPPNLIPLKNPWHPHSTHRSIAAACDELADVCHAAQVRHVLSLQQTLQTLFEARGGNRDGVVTEGNQAWGNELKAGIGFSTSRSV